MSARAAILDRVRKARRTGFVPVATAPPVAQPAAVGAAALLERFVAELKLVGVDSFVESSAEAVQSRVASLTRGLRVLAWDRERLPYQVGSMLPEALTGASARADQAAADVGVTGCAAAIAETGSLAMLSGPGTPRSASLLPALHVCIVGQDQIRASLGLFFAERAADIAGAACCYFITGPSRTADIELTLTLGVHGPGRVVVVIGPDREEASAR